MSRSLGELGAFLDEAEALLGLVAHQAVDGVAGRLLLDDLDPEERALRRVHGGFLELAGHHLAEALEAADLDLAVAVELASSAAPRGGGRRGRRRSCRPGVSR